jgi:hypothetical protein
MAAAADHLKRWFYEVSIQNRVDPSCWTACKPSGPLYSLL